MSMGPTIIETVFDIDLPGPEALAEVDGAAVVAAMTGWARVEAAAAHAGWPRSPS